MISHEVPLGVRSLMEMHARNAHMWRPEDREYAERMRALFTLAVLGVQPRLLVHGHHHAWVDEVVDYGSFECHVVGLAADGERGCVAVVDTQDLSVRTVEQRSAQRHDRQ